MISFLKTSAKVKKAASRKEQIKPLLQKCMRKSRKYESLVTIMLKQDANNIDTHVKMFKGENPEKNSIQLNSVK